MLSNKVKLNLLMKIKAYKMKRIIWFKTKLMKKKLKINNLFQEKGKYKRINKVLHSYKNKNVKK